MGPTCVVVSGVAGSGKSTVAEALAAQLNWEYLDADTLHSPENVERMRRGQPLTDELRQPWLSAISDWICSRAAKGQSTVIACSGLKRIYRDELRGSRCPVYVIQLVAPESVIVERLEARAGHYAGVALARSQFEAFEALESDEAGLQLSVELEPHAVIGEAVGSLGELRGGPGHDSGRFQA